MFLIEPTQAKSVNPEPNKSSRIQSTATFVRVLTKILVSVSPMSSKMADINQIKLTNKYDFPHPKAPCTSITLDPSLSF